MGVLDLQVPLFLLVNFQHQHGLLVNDQKFDPSQQTIPQVLNSMAMKLPYLEDGILKLNLPNLNHWEVLEDPDTFLIPLYYPHQERDKLKVTLLILLEIF